MKSNLEIVPTSSKAFLLPQLNFNIVTALRKIFKLKMNKILTKISNIQILF